MAHVSAAERRPQLIKAAIDLMAREGIAAGSTRAVAAELGVAQATVHYTLGSKEELYRAVLEHLSEELIARVRAAEPEGRSFPETVTAMARELWAAVRENPGHGLLLVELSAYAVRSPGLRESVGEHLRGVLAAASDIVSGAAERTGVQLAHPPEDVARFFLAGFDGLMTHRLLLDDLDVHEASLTHLITASVAMALGHI
ncbi:TetR/AcrR family transcriptional regulator [Allokutzneria sp. NRRL B-24872]|uniref:TetR/AcrR family transcriptional regulator n=1 Tax=Allokutzneria sp. NRRL B-24872 TaxID=1137961 RepID=UPI000A37FC16|nr:TetR/AcrR family transcriptional regulator [Allokutzneria sp. NRRL B-24872]